LEWIAIINLLDYWMADCFNHGLTVVAERREINATTIYIVEGKVIGEN
jgi:hypothetical protein